MAMKRRARRRSGREHDLPVQPSALHARAPDCTATVRGCGRRAAPGHRAAASPGAGSRPRPPRHPGHQAKHRALGRAEPAGRAVNLISCCWLNWAGSDAADGAQAQARPAAAQAHDHERPDDRRGPLLPAQRPQRAAGNWAIFGLPRASQPVIVLAQGPGLPRARGGDGPPSPFVSSHEMRVCPAATPSGASGGGLSAARPGRTGRGEPSRQMGVYGRGARFGDRAPRGS
jgi:hypothetical protein